MISNNVKIALIGQVNVGKSTLFNRLIEKDKAIISTVPGTTRDRNYGDCYWRGKKLVIIDTGGLEFKKGPKGQLQEQVKKQINTAIDEADLIFFIIETRPLSKLGIGPPISGFEREMSRLIKKSKKPSILVLNKADNPKKRKWGQSQKWLKLGFNKPMCISAANGSGIGDLLDKAFEKIKISVVKSEGNLVSLKGGEVIKVAIIGRPNVGKSTLLNSLLGEEKVIVSPVPHTTRGPQDTLVQIGQTQQSLLLIDTAGIRKRAKIKSIIEKIGVKQSLKTIQKSDLVLMLIDISDEIGHQDKALLRLIIKNKKALILVINKCDLLSKSDIDRLTSLDLIRQSLPMAWWAPIIFISAKTGKNVKTIFSLIQQTMKNYQFFVDNKKLNELLSQIIKNKNFNSDVWEKIKISQKEKSPPEFIIKAPQSIIRKKLIHQAQINIIEKQIRKKWGLKGVPIEVKIRSTKS